MTLNIPLAWEKERQWNKFLPEGDPERPRTSVPCAGRGGKDDSNVGTVLWPGLLNAPIFCRMLCGQRVINRTWFWPKAGA